MFIDILASKLSDVIGRPTRRKLSHTVLSCIVSSVHTSEQRVWCWWVVTMTYRYWLPVIVWPVKLCVYRYVFTFFSKSKKTWLFTFFWVVAHVSRILVCNSRWQRGHVAMGITDAAFSAVPFCNYTIRRTQYDRPRLRQLCYCMFCWQLCLSVL